MNTPPRVSIGLPVYNGERHLHAAIDSILAQTYGDFELIISDNASTDSTGEICRQYARQDARVAYHLLPENVGAAENFNRVFHQARGEYFKWAAHDDVCLPTFLERCVTALDAAPRSVVLCMPRTTLIDSAGRVVGDHDDELDLRQRFATGRMAELAVKILSCGCHSIFGLIRRDVLARTRLIGAYVASDTVLLSELAAEGQLWEIPERLFLARIHEDCSHRKFKTLEEYAEWFAPRGNGKYVRFLRTKLALEQVKGIARSSMSPLEKPLCATAFTAAWTARQARIDGGAMKQRLFRRLGLRGKAAAGAAQSVSTNGAAHQELDVSVNQSVN
ncbi:MAG TPA: glycosyltransferase family A protein [Tepidisphaeraceae bacterium]|nr:glycosyltransferase family A protein [Tepidisphaeraceae bacterium]